MTLYRRSPRALSQALELAQGDWEPETLLGEVQRVWADAVGEAIAAEATPTREQRGVLTVSCSAAVWAQELELMSLPILERLNRELHGGELTRMRCITLPPPG